MDKFRLSKSSLNFVNASLVNFISTILILLITFNLGWLIMFIRLYSQLALIKNLNKTIFNFESILLLGNLSIFVLFIAYALTVKSLRSILGNRS